MSFLCLRISFNLTKTIKHNLPTPAKTNITIMATSREKHDLIEIRKRNASISTDYPVKNDSERVTNAAQWRDFSKV